MTDFNIEIKFNQKNVLGSLKKLENTLKNIENKALNATKALKQIKSTNITALNNGLKDTSTRLQKATKDARSLAKALKNIQSPKIAPIKIPKIRQSAVQSSAPAPTRSVAPAPRQARVPASQIPFEKEAVNFLREQERVVKSILGPQETYNKKLAVTNRLFKEGKIDANQLANAQQKLKNSLDRATSTKTSQIVPELKKVNSTLNQVERSAFRLQSVFATLYVIDEIKQFTGFLTRQFDAYTNIGNSLKIVTNSSEQALAVQEKIFDLSIKTRTSVEDTANVFQRSAKVYETLGISINDQLRDIETLNKAIAVSGVTAQEGSQGLRQFLQGLASARLGGDELRSVLEQIPIVGDLIAERLNKIQFEGRSNFIRDDLRKLGEEGKLTQQLLVDAIRDGAGKIDALFAKTASTFDQAATVFQTRIIKVFGDLDKSFGVTNFGVKALNFLGENLETILRLVSTLAIAFAVDLGGKAIGVLIKNIGRLTTQIKKLGVIETLLIKPLRLLPTLLITGGAAMVAFSDKIGVATDKVDAFGNNVKVTFSDVLSALFSSGNEDNSPIDGFVRASEKDLKKLEDSIKKSSKPLKDLGQEQGVDSVTKKFKLAEQSSSSFERATTASFKAVSNGAQQANRKINDTIKVINKTSESSKKLGADSRTFWGKLADDMSNAFTKLGDFAVDAFIDISDGFTRIIADAQLGAKAITGAFSGFFDYISTQIKLMVNFFARAFNDLSQGAADLLDTISFGKINIDPLQIELPYEINPEDAERGVVASIKKGINDAVEEGLKVRDEILARPTLREKAEEAARRRQEKEERDRLKGLEEEARLADPREGVDSPDAGLAGLAGSGANGKNENGITFNEILAAAGREADLLQFTIREREVIEQLLIAEDQLKRDLTKTEKDLLSTQLKANQGLTIRRQFLENIAGPQELFDAQLVELNKLLSDGIITQEDYTSELRKMNDVLAQSNPLLQKELELLDRIEKPLKDYELGLKALNNAIDAGVISKELAAEVLEDLEEAYQNSTKEGARQAELLKQVIEPAEEYAKKLKSLNELIAKNPELTQEFIRVQMELRQTFLDTQRDAASGAESALLAVNDQFTNMATVTKDAIVNAVQESEDAFVNFVQTGKFEFSSLVDSVMADVARLAVREALTKPIVEAFGVSATGEDGKQQERFGSVFDGFVDKLDGLFGDFGDEYEEILGDFNVDFSDTLSQIVNGIGSLFSGSGGGSSDVGGDLLSGIGSLFSSSGGGDTSSGASSAGGSSFISDLASFGSLIGFNSGGSLEVGGNSGVDRNLLSINNQPVARVSKGEQVNIIPNNKDGGGSSSQPINVSVTINVQNPTNVSEFNKSQSQLAGKAAQVFQRALSRK